MLDLQLYAYRDESCLYEWFDSHLEDLLDNEHEQRNECLTRVLWHGASLLQTLPNLYQNSFLLKTAKKTVLTTRACRDREKHRAKHL